MFKGFHKAIRRLEEKDFTRCLTFKREYSVPEPSQRYPPTRDKKELGAGHQPKKEKRG